MLSLLAIDGTHATHHERVSLRAIWFPPDLFWLSHISGTFITVATVVSLLSFSALLP